ncbi:MAG: autotransporter-associated beta strand repeat-containing protein [Pirellulales bacterium]|nr:autotransporter-associated beta strand repeat-containing protein [Pirellulales bacterium]
MFFAIAGLIAAMPTFAAAAAWNVASGDFNVGANWDTTSIPGAGEAALIQNDGTATLSGAFPNTIAYFAVGSATNTGTLALQSSAVLNVTNTTSSTVGSSTGVAYLTLKDTAELNFDAGTVTNLAPLVADRAVLTVQDSAVANFGRMRIGREGSAAVYQTGGTIKTINTTTPSGWYFGVNTLASYGYYRISGGSFLDNTNNEFAFGYYGTGIMDQSGSSSVTFGRTMRLGGGLGSYGEYNMRGGVASFNAVGWNSHVGIGGDGVLNISGGTMSSYAKFYLGYYGGKGIVNIGTAGTAGGTLAITSFFNSTGLGIINFHGGTLKAILSAENANFLDGTTNYIYGGGAVIDTDGNNVKITSELRAPTGSGLSSIPLTGNGSGYIGAPAVRISGGGGAGGSAVANFDPVTGTVTGITITNPGIYSFTPTITLEGGGATTAATIDYSGLALAGNASGGLTKIGLGKLTLAGNCTFTGPASIQQGTLELDKIEYAGSAIAVAAAGTLAGSSPDFWSIAYPATTVSSGGSIAPGSPGRTLALDSLALSNNSNLKFSFDGPGNVDAIQVVNNASSSGGAATVNVSFTGVPSSPTVLLSAGGTLDANLTFVLPAPALDSFDGINTSSATLTTVYGAGGSVTLSPAGAIADPAWNNASGGSWSTAANWGPPNTVPNGGDKRGMFTASLGGPVAIPVSLDISPQLSSLIFKGASGESYTITPTDSGKTITLKSTIAPDWHVSVLSGEHAVAAGLKLAAGAGQSVIRLADSSHLTLSGVLSDDTTAAGFSFEGNFNAGTGTGVLTLSGASTYSGPTVIRSGVLEVTGLSDAGAAGPLGAAAASPSNLVFQGGTLKYVGGSSGSTNRGFTLLGSAGISTAQDITFSGKVTGTPQTCNFTKTGAGGLKLSSVLSDMAFKNLYVDEGSLSLEGTSTTKPTYTVLDGLYGDLVVGMNAHAATLNLTNVNLAFGSGNLYVGNGAGATGFANINAGVKITSENQFWWLVGVDGAQGVVNQTDGNVQVGVLTQIATGASSWGVHNLSGGILKNDYDFQVGAADGMGVFNQTGGTHNVGRLSIIANDATSWGVYNMSGGTADINSNGWSFNIGNSGTGQGIVNLSGSAHMTSGTVFLGVYDTGTGILNLGAVGSGGGLLSVAAIGQYSASPGTSTGYLNFHGGVLQATADSTSFLGAYAQMDGIYIYKEGAKIDSNGHAITIDSALLIPSGQGVTGISLANAGSGYIGEPLVQITGGSGTGATARAVMSGDHVDHIEITNPGTGYLGTDVLTVSLVGGVGAGGTSATAGAVGFAVNDTTGGLTKLGASTLTLSGSLSYLGNTFVNQGTLTITTPLNTPAASVSVATGATLNAASIVANSLNVGVPPLAAAAVPEPGSLALLALAGLAGALAFLRRK